MLASFLVLLTNSLNLFSLVNNKARPDFLSYKTVSPIEDFDTSEAGVLNLLLQINERKCGGPDNIRT